MPISELRNDALVSSVPDEDESPLVIIRSDEIVVVVVSPHPANDIITTHSKSTIAKNFLLITKLHSARRAFSLFQNTSLIKFVFWI